MPVLRGSVVTLREPRLSDAAALWSMLASTEVSRRLDLPISEEEKRHLFEDGTANVFGLALERA